MTRHLHRVTLCAGLLALGCAADVEEGEVAVRVYGEAFIEEGIPAEAMSDGWSVSFSRFEVQLRDITLGETSLPDPATVDLTLPSAGEGQLLTSGLAPTGDYRAAAYTIARIEVEGSAEREGVRKTFAWVFDAPTRYAPCEIETEIGESAGGFEVTVHADHLFYDSIVAADPSLGFQAFADADADADGAITQAELSETGIGLFDPGSAGSVDDLWSWLEALAATVGHVNGEGHCELALQD